MIASLRAVRSGVLACALLAGCYEPSPAPPRASASGKITPVPLPSASGSASASASAAPPSSAPTATSRFADPAGASEAIPRPSAAGPLPGPGAPAAADAPVVPSIEFTTGNANPSERLPLVIALHGFGDSPSGFAPMFAGFGTKARVVLPHSDKPIGEGYMWFKLRQVGSPEDAGALGDMADAVVAFAKKVASTRPTLGKPIVTGFSQGGALSYAIAVRHPWDIAAALPVSGWLPHGLLPKGRLKNAAPVFAFHGTADSRVAIALGRQARADLMDVGVPVTWHEFEGVEHSIPAVTRKALFEELAKICDAQK